MNIGDETTVMGFVTQLKFLNGRTLLQIEGLLGFHGGRLSAGATVFASRGCRTPRSSRRAAIPRSPIIAIARRPVSTRSPCAGWR
jgi:hypothetical protein